MYLLGTAQFLNPHFLIHVNFHYAWFSSLWPIKSLLCKDVKFLKGIYCDLKLKLLIIQARILAVLDRCQVSLVFLQKFKIPVVSP